MMPTDLKPAAGAPGLASLAAEVRRDLERLLFPAPNWVPPVAGPDGRPVLDALIVGGGMCGQTAAFALVREGVRNVRTIDRAARGREAAWVGWGEAFCMRGTTRVPGWAGAAPL